MLLLVDVLQQALLEGRQVEEQVLGLADDRRRPAQLAARVDQLDRVERPAAVVALVATSAGVAAVRAGALDVAVGQEARVDLAVELLLRLRVDVAVGVQRPEDVLRDGEVVLGVGVGEEVERDAEVAPGFEEADVVALEVLARRQPLLLGANRDRRAVRVAAGDHQDAVAAQAVVAGEDVRRDVRAGQVPQMQVAVGVRPGNKNADRLVHLLTSSFRRGQRPRCVLLIAWMAGRLIDTGI